ncbi:MAG: anthranilate synthase component I family protein [Ferruginibacter sp.]
MHNRNHFPLDDLPAFKLKLLGWVSQFSIFCFLDNNNYYSPGNTFECIVAAGSKASVTLTRQDPFLQLRKFYDNDPGWIFGHLGFELNNGYGKLEDDFAGFADGFFFSPLILIKLTKNELIFELCDSGSEEIFQQIENFNIVVPPAIPLPTILQKISRDEYIQTINKIKEHIQRGDCYELNFCQEFFMHTSIDPVSVFKNLQSISPNPFSAFYRVEENYCLSASPERYLKKTGSELISQPIKGTSKRDVDPVKDEKNKSYLQNSQKEKSENVMIVDLVRNDMSKICVEASVHVEEIFGLYSFPQVHQLISTIKGDLPADVHFTDALQATFPMGSMTGAPKLKVLELISRYEKNNRGLFSGSIGYVTPDQNFDFNVIIRSIFYNRAGKYVSFRAGSGITFYSDPALEYEECLMKAEAMLNVLGN